MLFSKTHQIMGKLQVKRIGFCLLFFLTVQEAFSKVILSPLFSDNMVLQQKEKVALWGKSTGRNQVIVTTSWNGKKYTVSSDAAGKWSVVVATPKAGGPFSIFFDDGEVLKLENVMIGEVWICSGQSNMEMPLEGWGKIKNYKEEVAAAHFPNIRLLKVERSTSTQPLLEAQIKEGWQACSPATVADFSAVAYFFARNIQANQNVPVGLIQTAYSGTPAESWVSGPSLRQMKEYDSLVTVISSKLDAPKNSHIPTVLYNAMINPLVPYGIRGFLWYQGESNAARAHQYKTLFPLLIEDWRKGWGGKERPFFFVQLANFKEVAESPGESDWAELREAQLETLSLPNTGMAVTIDLGEVKDIHPKNKQDVGLRLSRIARKKVYKENISYAGPLYKNNKVKGSTIQLSFNHTDGGLMAKGGDQLLGFSIAGEDKKFHWAKADIKGEKVIVWSDAVQKPVAVRYAWAINPRCNLYNGAGLPASPFRTDKWKGVTGPK